MYSAPSTILSLYLFVILYCSNVWHNLCNLWIFLTLYFISRFRRLYTPAFSSLRSASGCSGRRWAPCEANMFQKLVSSNKYFVNLTLVCGWSINSSARIDLYVKYFTLFLQEGICLALSDWLMNVYDFGWCLSFLKVVRRSWTCSEYQWILSSLPF